MVAHACNPSTEEVKRDVKNAKPASAMWQVSDQPELHEALILSFLVFKGGVRETMKQLNS